MSATAMLRAVIAALLVYVGAVMEQAAVASARWIDMNAKGWYSGDLRNRCKHLSNVPYAL